VTEIARIDFKTLRRPLTPNTFLMAPEGLCERAKSDTTSPAFAVEAAVLRQEFLRIVIAQPRVAHKFADEAGLYDELVVRSAVFGFPDLVAVKFLARKGKRSTLALYARAVYGFSDLGVNRARSLRWLRLLAAAVKPAET
jgi:uncharacterized protein (DUF1499 family)